MYTRVVLGMGLLTLTVLLLVSCGAEDDGVGPIDDTSGVLYVDQAIVQDTSQSVTAEYLASRLVSFDFDGIQSVELNQYDDIYVFYGTVYPPDIGHLVYHCNAHNWVIFVYPPEPTFGIPIGGRHGHMISRSGFHASEFIDDSLHLALRPTDFVTMKESGESSEAGHQAKAVMYHDGYKPVVVPNSDRFYVRGMAFDGADYFLIRADINREFYFERLSSTGTVHFRDSIQLENPYGLAADGADIWITDFAFGSEDSVNFVYRAKRTGELVDSFLAPTRFPGGITFVNDDCWLSDLTENDYRIFVIDDEASISSGSAEITDTINFGKAAFSLAWDGANILVASDSLYVITTDGTVQKQYPWTIGGERRIDYRDGVVHVLGSGPSELYLTDHVIVPLRMR